MVAVQQPSADHLNIYIGLVFAIAFVGYFLYSQFASKQPNMYKEQLFLSDMVDTSESSVNKDAAFHKQLDQLGAMAREISGVLTKESFAKLRAAITEKTYVEFKDRRDQMLNERIVLMRMN